MEARSAMSLYCGSLLGVVVALFLSASLGTGAGVGAGGVDLKESCAATPQPDVCMRALQKYRDATSTSKDAAGVATATAAATTPLALAQAAIRAASDAGAAAGSYARREMDVVKENVMWQCLNECAEDIEEALSHLDDSEDDSKLKEVKLFLSTAEQDTWNCDQSCKAAPNTPVKDALLAKNKEFEGLMAIALALMKRAAAGESAAQAPASATTAKP